MAESTMSGVRYRYPSEHGTLSGFHHVARDLLILPIFLIVSSLPHVEDYTYYKLKSY